MSPDGTPSFWASAPDGTKLHIAKHGDNWTVIYPHRLSQSALGADWENMYHKLHTEFQGVLKERDAALSAAPPAAPETGEEPT